jgi:diguanylate cyclase (GGDEF)-like protein
MFSRIKNIIKNYSELKYLAYHDSLTGLLNRNWLYKNIDLIKGKYVYFIDIDNLHNINKNGHIFGDNHIIKCVENIKKTQHKYLIRYAGDEFIIISDEKINFNTNNLYTIGHAVVNKSINDAIYIADKNMLKNKNRNG